jgi:ring-1,2-phenylacetyl-CoA epoxidase subunit PaaD
VSVATMAPEDRASIAAVAARALPSLDNAWTALASVADPEIPVVSVIELGIVRGVRRDADDAALLVVTITPTYSGCPATEVIAAAVRAALTAVGIARTRIETCLSPAWTTDWITPEGRRKLREFGIAPPDGLRAIPKSVAIDISGISRLRRPVVAISCPRCASKRTKLVSQFGSTACKAHYRCLDCLEPFDYFKPH